MLICRFSAVDNLTCLLGRYNTVTETELKASEKDAAEK